MKKIEQGLDEAYEKCGDNAYFGNGFRAGVEFAQQWMQIERDQYAFIDEKQKQEIINNMPILAKWENDIDVFTEYSELLEEPDYIYWRPIELK